MLRAVQGASLVLATMGAGLMAGVFGLYAHTIMPGLGRADDRTFLGAFQAIDRAIINRWFIPTFTGTLVLIGATTALHLSGDAGDVLPWAALALTMYVAVVVITLAVHVPRNDQIKAAGPPDGVADLAAVRARFDEDRWARWNLVRVVLSTASLGCLAWGLVLHGGAG